MIEYITRLVYPYLYTIIRINVIITNDEIFFILSDLLITKFDEIYKKNSDHKLNVKINL